MQHLESRLARYSSCPSLVTPPYLPFFILPYSAAHWTINCLKSCLLLLLLLLPFLTCLQVYTEHHGPSIERFLWLKLSTRLSQSRQKCFPTGNLPLLNPLGFIHALVQRQQLVELPTHPYSDVGVRIYAKMLTMLPSANVKALAGDLSLFSFFPHLHLMVHDKFSSPQHDGASGRVWSIRSGQGQDRRILFWQHRHLSGNPQSSSWSS
jgi:hypothetical protein